MNDETIRLILDLANSSKDVSELVGKLGELKGKADSVGSTYQVLAGEMGTYEVAERKATETSRQYTPALDAQVEKAVEATRAQKALREALEVTAAAQEKTSGTSKEMSMRILNLGRAAQDLAQGGIGGVINNIEGIVGGGGLAAGALTALGTAALLATPYIKEYWKSLGGGAEKIPPAAKEMDRYTEAINKNKKALQELKEKEELTYFELEKYKKLVEETTKLEEDQALKRDARLVQTNSDKKSRERASAVRETIAERFGSSQELIDLIMSTEHGKQIGLARVEEIMAGAQKGNGLDLASLRNVSPKFNEMYEPFSPERKAQDKLDEERLKKEAAIDQERMAQQNMAAKKVADSFARLGHDLAQGQKAGARADAAEARANARSDDFMRNNIPKMIAQMKQREEVRGVQNDVFNETGISLTPKQALQELNYRKRLQEQIDRAQAETLGTILQTTQGLQNTLQMWKQNGRNATRQFARTSQNNGNP